MGDWDNFATKKATGFRLWLLMIIDYFQGKLIIPIM